MVSKSLRVVFILVLCSFLLAGCGKGKKTAADGGGENAGGEPAAESGAGSVSTTGTLGSLKFTAAGGGKSVEFAADGKTAGVTVTDAAGYVWTLSVPADALLNPRTITMTPMDSLDSSGSKVAVTSGVLLEPDGLTFLKPATLTVKPPAGGVARGVLLTARHDGSALRFAETESADGSLSAPLWHFSAGALAGGDDKAPIISAARQEYQAAKAAAQALLRSRQAPLEELPTPPSVSAGCSGSKDDATRDREAQEIDRFMAALSQPEGDVLRRLLGAGRALALLGEDTGTEGMDIAARVAERVVGKAERLMDQFGDDPEKLPALAQALLRSARTVELLGGETVDLTPLAQMVRQNSGQLLAKLRNEHDYTVVQELVEMERLSQALGMEDDDFLEKLGKALVFKLFIDNTSTFNADQGRTLVATQGEITLRHWLQRETIPAPWEWEGNGRISYLKGETVVKGVTFPMVGPDGFEVRVGLNHFDACVGKTVDIVMHGKFFEQKMGTFRMPPPINTAPGPIPTGLALFHLNEEAIMRDGFVSITVPLRNKQAEAVNETRDFEANFKDTFQFRLTHMPE